MNKVLRRNRINTRTVVGIALIAISVGGVLTLVRLNSHASATLVATHLLVEGQQITAADFTSRDVQIEEVSDAYLSEPSLAVGKVVLRSIAPGELIPRASLGDASEVIETSVVVEVDSPLASRVKAGSIVDLWASSGPTSSREMVGETVSAPELIVGRARVAAFTDSPGSFGGVSERVELVVERSQVPDVLAAQSKGLSFHVVASSGGTFS